MTDKLGKKTIESDARKVRVLAALGGTPGTATDHGTLTGLGDDDHPQYGHLSQNETVTGQWSFSPAAAQPPFVLGANAQGQLVTGLRADELNKTITAGDGLSGGGTLTGNLTLDVDLAPHSGLEFSTGELTLGTPTAVTVSSANTVALSTHTHAVTSSSNPGAAASLLASDANGRLQLQRLGVGVAPSYPLHARLSTEQLRLDYDASNYASFTVSSGGNLTLAPTGDLVLNPTGNDVVPLTSYDLNIGSPTKRYLTLHAAELWVQTLVAQNTVATFGGRLLVAPSNELIADVGTSDTTISVKYNNLTNGDRVYFEADGQVEWMAVTGNPADIAGGYQYAVTRNLDGTGANLWYAGDAVV
ncbi:MAG TPA: hypothetical protein PK530_00625, partial [Anaerolineales bacterium]|nr:hypothetical protein [Anaerolineales bacterium]